MIYSLLIIDVVGQSLIPVFDGVDGHFGALPNYLRVLSIQELLQVALIFGLAGHSS